MTPTVAAIADVIFDMKPPHYHAQDFRVWQEWAHRLGGAVVKGEGLAQATAVEFMERAGIANVQA